MSFAIANNIVVGRVYYRAIESGQWAFRANSRFIIKQPVSGEILLETTISSRKVDETSDQIALIYIILNMQQKEGFEK